MCSSTSTLNFLTAPGGTAGSVGSTFWNFSKAMPFASASVGADGSAAAAGLAAMVLTTVVVSPELPPASTMTQATTATSANRPAKKPMMPATSKKSWRVVRGGADGGMGGS